VDRFGGTWVRADDMPGRYGNWWPRTDGPGFEKRVHNGIGTSRRWDEVDPEYGPFKPAPRQLVTETLELVRKARR
jgi:hypothetical protein